MAATEPDPIAIIPPGSPLEQDPDIYAAVKKLALATVDAAIDILDTGAPAQQLQMIRITLPKLTAALRTAPEDDKGELRASVAAIYEQVIAVLDPPTATPVS